MVRTDRGFCFLILFGNGQRVTEPRLTCSPQEGGNIACLSPAPEGVAAVAANLHSARQSLSPRCRSPAGRKPRSGKRNVHRRARLPPRIPERSGFRPWPPFWRFASAKLPAWLA